MSRLELGSRLGGILALLLAVSVGCGPGPETKRPPEKEPDALHSVRMAQSLFRAGRVSEALATLDAAIAR